MVSLADAQTKQKEIGESLLAGSFKYSVLFVTIDSSQFYNNAFVVLYGDYFLLFTEHHGYHIEHTDEVLKCNQFVRVEIEQVQ